MDAMPPRDDRGPAAAEENETKVRFQELRCESRVMNRNQPTADAVQLQTNNDESEEVELDVGELVKVSSSNTG